MSPIEGEPAKKQNNYVSVIKLIDEAETQDGFAALSIDQMKDMLDSFAELDNEVESHAFDSGQRKVSVTFLNGKAVYRLCLLCSDTGSTNPFCRYSLKEVMQNIEEPDMHRLGDLQLAIAFPATEGFKYSSSLRAAINISKGMAEMREMMNRVDEENS